MKQKIHSILKGIYLLSICISLPISLWWISHSSDWSQTVRGSIGLATYVYAPLWLIFFIGIGYSRFPTKLRDAIELTFIPMLNALVVFLFMGGNPLDFVSGSANYFRATTIALTFFTFTWIPKIRSQKNKKLFVSGIVIWTTITLSYATLINYDYVKDVIERVTLRESILDAWFIVLTSLSIFHSLFVIQKNPEEIEANQPQNTQKKKISNRSTELFVIIGLLSALASMFAIWNG